MQHFLQETDLPRSLLPECFALARSLKKGRGRHTPPTLAGQSWALIFNKSSTRTRVSFEVGLRELGANCLFLNRQDIQLGRGESIADTARVLSRYLHGLIVRTYDHNDVLTLARHGSIPVINALTDLLHPCQSYTDLFTLAERWSPRGEDLIESLTGKSVAFFGDCGCNVANSWMLAAAYFGMDLRLSGPAKYAPGAEVLNLIEEAGLQPRHVFFEDPLEAAADADAIYTDVWVSMGMEDESKERLETLRPYQVNSGIMRKAKQEALFLHCLPAHPGEEVTHEVLEGPQSIVFDQAENRLHMQKAILSLLGQRPRP